ncbi:MAG: efflux RND transporter periplasmic adaptor subunit [Acidobacteriota bacterium]
MSPGTRPFAVLTCLLAVACGRSNLPATDHGESWAVTAWGERYEIFAETPALVAGTSAAANTHVTRLGDFAPVTDATVTALLRSPSQGERASKPGGSIRPGIFKVELPPCEEGEFELVFRVEAGGDREDVPGGRVRVGSAASPGGPVIEGEEAAGHGDQATTFLKEQQWRTRFATALAAQGSLRRSVRGMGRITPPAGGAVELTAAVEGSVNAARWPYVGADVEAGATVFSISPRNTSGRSLGELEAAEASLEAELQAANARLGRLRQLAAVEAVSLREVEETEALVTSVQARLAAARRDAETARSARGSAAGGEVVSVRAPFAGRVAIVHVTPGQTVEAGAPLARVVKTRPLWLEVALAPSDASLLGGDPHGLTLRASATDGSIGFGRDEVRLIARAPEVDPASGTVKVALEIGRSVDQLQIGAAVEAEVLLAEEVRGIALPSSAVVDDAGVSVVYIQLGGESFARREVTVPLRQGNLLLVGGLTAGERVVTVGGAAIRRSELISSGSVEGHVH